MTRIKVTLDNDLEDFMQDIYVDSDQWYEIEKELNDKYGINKWLAWKPY